MQNILSIPQWLARLQGVGDALLGFAFAAEGDERFALQVEDVLFADELRRRERAAGKDVGEFVRDESIVFRYIFAAQQHVDGELGGGAKLLAEDADRRVPRRGRRLAPFAAD